MTNLDDYQFDCHPLFRKEFKKIIKKHQCPSLKEDFYRLKIALVQDLEDNNHTFSVNYCTRISGLENKVTLPSFIVKKFRCQNINKGSRSGFRLTFVFYPDENIFYFVEIFNKNKKAIEDKERINNLF
jgi:mRNA-degrading endonuclease RelE of RelBE toxin-antitoxin system